MKRTKCHGTLCGACSRFAVRVVDHGRRHSVKGTKCHGTRLRLAFNRGVLSISERLIYVLVSSGNMHMSKFYSTKDKHNQYSLRDPCNYLA